MEKIVMKKAAIITLNGYFNYGNRLQNYAVQEVLKYLGFSVETVIVKPSVQSSFAMAKPVHIFRRLITTYPVKTLLKRNRKFQYYVINAEKSQAFKRFSFDNIVEVDHGLKENSSPPDLANMYNYFISGSDQVWNPNYIRDSSTYFLTFAPKEKRVAYAASFGVSEIPDEYKGLYSKWLSEMHRISVREKAGAEIVKELTGRDAVVVVDPTMVLSKEKWLSLAKPAVAKPDENYLLTYFIGQKTKATKLKIEELASTYGLKVINLADFREPERYVADPAEFIEYINSASLVCTDSFHGAVFSILMEKPFIVFKRQELGDTAPSLYSRIDTLLRTFKLESRKAEYITEHSDVLDVDYSHVPSILAVERKKATDYLKEALNVRDNSDKQYDSTNP